MSSCDAVTPKQHSKTAPKFQSWEPFAGMILHWRISYFHQSLHYAHVLFIFLLLQLMILFMVPQLITAQSAYKDIRICSFYHSHTHTHTLSLSLSHTHTHYKYMHYRVMGWYNEKKTLKNPGTQTQLQSTSYKTFKTSQRMFRQCLFEICETC